MKTKLFIVAALCATAFNASAQTEKGKMLVGGTIQFQTNKTEVPSSSFKNTQSNFNLQPQFGFFVANNFSVGAGLSYSRTKFKNTNPIANPNQSVYQTLRQNYGFGPVVRYYVNIVERLKFFGQINTSIMFGTNELTSTTGLEKYKSTAYNADLSPNLAFFPTKKIAIELGIGILSYSHMKEKHKDDETLISKTDNFNIGINALNPRIGINLHF